MFVDFFVQIAIAFLFCNSPFLLYKPENHCAGYRDCATNFYEIISGIFCFPEMYNAALITTVGNGAGILLGQLLGDFIIKINAAKITPDLYINIGEE